MSSPTFKDFDAATRWVSNHGHAVIPNAAMVEDLAFFIAAIRYTERQRCADECEKYDQELANPFTFQHEGIPHDSLEVVASRIRALGALEPRP